MRRLAVNNDWLLEGGWGLYLVRAPAPLSECALTAEQQGCHFVRCGVEGLGSELQRRGIARQAQWGARGLVSVFVSRFLVTVRSQPHAAPTFPHSWRLAPSHYRSSDTSFPPMLPCRLTVLSSRLNPLCKGPTSAQAWTPVKRSRSQL